MGILDSNLQEEFSEAYRSNMLLKRMTKNTYDQMVNAFNHGSELFWNNDQATPQEIANELGTDAKEVFELHGKLGTLLSEINPQAIASGLSVVGSFTYNADGTITIN